MSTSPTSTGTVVIAVAAFHEHVIQFNTSRTSVPTAASTSAGAGTRAGAASGISTVNVILANRTHLRAAVASQAHQYRFR